MGGDAGGRRPRSPFCHSGSVAAPSAGLCGSRGDGCRPAQLPSPHAVTGRGPRSTPPRGPGPRPSHPAPDSPVQSSRRRPLPSVHPSPLRWRWVSKSCAENPEVGGKKGKLATVRGPGSGGWGGVRGELNIGALFPFPGRDMINRFLLI